MKMKMDFVTNSSSCSFTIPKKYLNELQVIAIKKHIEFAMLLGTLYPKRWDFGFRDEWTVVEHEKILEVKTYMDNFDMQVFLDAIGVPREALENYEHSNSHMSQAEEDDNPCPNCVVVATCKKSFVDGSACKRYAVFLQQEMLNAGMLKEGDKWLKEE
jgi:hypothetical protein